MDEQFNSIVKQLNKLAQKQTGLNPKAKTIERALKTFVDAYSGGGAGGDSIWGNITGSIENQTDLIDKIDSMIDDELANFEHLDYEVVDTEPTPATAEEGVRYLYKPAGATAYNEYILIGGTIYNIGSTEDVNLTNYYTKAEVDAELIGKADVSDLPTKTSDLTNDSLFVDKDTDQLTNYTKTTELNNALNLKADKSTTYTKDEVNDKLDLKADTDDIPTKTSDLTNDSGFITKSVNNLDNYTKTTDLNTALGLKANATDVPTKTSDLTNDTGYIDANVNNLTNYTKTSDLNTSLGLKVDKTSVKNAKSTTATDVYNAPYINTTIGDLTSLKTNSKTSLVSATNELSDLLNNTQIYHDLSQISNTLSLATSSVNDIYAAMRANSLAMIQFNEDHKIAIDFNLSYGGMLLLIKGYNAWRGMALINAYKTDEFIVGHSTEQNNLVFNSIPQLVTDNKVSDAKTLNAGAYDNFTIDISKSGYTPIGIMFVDTSTNNTLISKYSQYGNNCYVRVKNDSSSSANITVTVKILYTRN